MDDELVKPSLFQAFEHYGVRILGPDRGSWVKSECPRPEHEDANPSASVNEEAGRWRCHTCDVGGDVFDLIMEQEPDVEGFAAAKRRAEELFGEMSKGSDNGSGLLPRRTSGRRNRGVRAAPWTRL